MLRLLHLLLSNPYEIVNADFLPDPKKKAPAPKPTGKTAYQAAEGSRMVRGNEEYFSHLSQRACIDLHDAPEHLHISCPFRLITYSNSTYAPPHDAHGTLSCSSDSFAFPYVFLLAGLKKLYKTVILDRKMLSQPPLYNAAEVNGQVFKVVTTPTQAKFKETLKGKLLKKSGKAPPYKAPTGLDKKKQTHDPKLPVNLKPKDGSKLWGEAMPPKGASKTVVRIPDPHAFLQTGDGSVQEDKDDEHYEVPDEPMSAEDKATEDLVNSDASEIMSFLSQESNEVDQLSQGADIEDE